MKKIQRIRKHVQYYYMTFDTIYTHIRKVQSKILTHILPIYFFSISNKKKE